MSASRSFDVRSHPTKGRAAFATKTISAGDIVFVSTALIILPDNAHLSQVCTFCFKPGTLRACSRCHASYYCTTKCQSADWKTIHSKECLSLTSCGPRPPPTAVRATMQAFLNSGTAQRLETLEGHLEQRKKGASWSDIELMAMGACSFSKTGVSGEQLARAADLLCKVCKEKAEEGHGYCVSANKTRRFKPTHSLGTTAIRIDQGSSLSLHSLWSTTPACRMPLFNFLAGKLC